MSAAGRPPRVGLDASRGFGPEPTGTEHYAREVIGRLLARGRFRYRLYLRDAPPPALAGTDARRLWAPRLWTHTALAAELARRPPDLLFVPAHVLPLWPLPPAVVTVHDLGYRVFPEAHGAWRRRYLDWSTRRHARLARRVIADSAATRDDLVAHYGAEPGRIEVVHLGVDADLGPAPPAAVAALRARLELPEGARYLVHVGTRQPRKNLARLVRAFAPLAAADPGLHLVLAGAHGWGREDYGAALGLGLEGRLRLPGYVDRSALAALYSGAVAAVLPSLYEGFGLTALEAMACGAPLACSGTSSLPEVTGEAALSFDPLDEAAISASLARLLADEALRRRLAAAGRARAATFTWDRCAARTEAVLARALGEAP